MTEIWQKYDRNMTGIWQECDRDMTEIWQRHFDLVNSCWVRYSDPPLITPPIPSTIMISSTFTLTTLLVSLIALALKSLFSNDGGIGGWWRRAALRLPPSSRTRGCLHRRLDLGEGCPVGWSRLRVRQNANHEILQEENLEKLSTLSLPHTWHVYTRNIPGIYLVYTWHMPMYVVTQGYTSKKLYGSIPHQSRTLIDMWYSKDILGKKIRLGNYSVTGVTSSSMLALEMTKLEFSARPRTWLRPSSVKIPNYVWRCSYFLFPAIWVYLLGVHAFW